ncbi:MAG: ECF transporter S component [Caldilineaceae bacterium]
MPVPNPSGNATIMHVPAIIAGIIAGPISGLIVGGIFGLYSFLSSTTILRWTRCGDSAAALYRCSPTSPTGAA